MDPCVDLSSAPFYGFLCRRCHRLSVMDPFVDTMSFAISLADPCVDLLLGTGRLPDSPVQLRVFKPHFENQRALDQTIS